MEKSNISLKWDINSGYGWLSNINKVLLLYSLIIIQLSPLKNRPLADLVKNDIKY